MKAIVLVEPGHVEVRADWPEPDPAAADVVVQMHGVGLCGSDLGVYDGKRASGTLPWVMGHEGGGRIVAVGSAVADRHVGQHVVIEPNFCCFQCPPCRAGATSACLTRRSVGLNHPGLLAERVAIPARFTWPVPAHWPAQTLACVEPVTVARSAVRRSGISAGDRCLVVGAGSQGLFVCLALLAVGAQPAVVEPHPGRLDKAVALGARAADAGDDPYPFVFETAGVAAAAGTAIDHTAPVGRIILIGMAPAELPISGHDLVRRQLTVQGSLIYDHPGDFPDAIAAIDRGEIDPDRVAQPGILPEQAPQAFAQARQIPGKAWLDLTSWPDLAGVRAQVSRSAQQPAPRDDGTAR